MRNDLTFVNPTAKCFRVLLWFCGIGRDDGKIIQFNQRHDAGS